MKRRRQRHAAPTPGWLGRGRLAAGGLILALAVGLAVALLATPLPAALERAPRPTVALPTRAATSTAIPQPVGPTAVPSYVRPQLTSEEAVAIVAAQPALRDPGKRLADVVGSQWTAEYRGDGTWIVRAGEPAWLVLERGRVAMPANIAAINLQGAEGGPRLH